MAILQARCSSTRLPGKVLEPLLDRPMILRQVERLLRCELVDDLVVATSVDPSDDILAELLEAEGIKVVRGSLDDVASRFAMVVDRYQPDSIVRLTADCPLADHRVIDDVVREHLASRSDYTSNTTVRTYPQGLDTECVTAEAFGRMMRRNLTPSEREHVTLAIYSHPAEFSIHSVTQEPDRSLLRWTVDLPADLAFVRSVYAELYGGNRDFLQDDILGLITRRPELNHTN